MEIIPLIYAKNRKIHAEKEGNPVSLDEVLERVNKDGEIYFLDIDGIEKNKPNLCLYQKISENHELWVDAGPRVLGDIVDHIIAGATRITIRKNLFSIEEIPNIKEVTESMIYSDVDLRNEKERTIVFSLLPGVDGLVVFSDKNQIEMDFKTGELLKTLCNKYKVYVAESDEKNISYWKNSGVAGVLLDLKKIKQVNRGGF